jgi:ribulose 1,5-bisphosphate synthetase/thiazole synthase
MRQRGRPGISEPPLRVRESAILDFATPRDVGQKDREANEEPLDILIVGAGVAGISAARDIQKSAILGSKLTKARKPFSAILSP